MKKDWKTRLDNQSNTSNNHDLKPYSHLPIYNGASSYKFKKIRGPRIKKIRGPRIKKIRGPRIKKIRGPRIKKMRGPRIMVDTSK